jgi:hypothetical protein
MAYLYAGLGVAMLAGIMAIFEMGLALTGQSLIPPTVDAYLGDPTVKVVDQKLLRLLKDPGQVDAGLEGTVLCKAVISAYQSAFPLDGNTFIEDATPPLSNNWLNACVVNNKSHRILITPDIHDASLPYQLYSCILGDVEDRCSFERES